MRLGIKGGGTVEEVAAAEHHPARLQLFISTVHKTPAQTQTQCIYFCVLYCGRFEYVILLLEGGHFCSRPKLRPLDLMQNEFSSNKTLYYLQVVEILCIH